MVTNKKFTLPNQNNSTLNFKIKFTTPLPPSKKKSQSFKNQHPSPRKKNLPNLHDLERFNKKLCMCTKHFIIFCLYEKL